MARINTNVPSMVARANLQASGAELQTRLQRLSTGLRINRGADDPAGLIISERLRSDIEGNDQAISNSERASSVIATSEGSLSEVGDLLNSIRALIVQSANTGASSSAERDANQLQIDSAIDSITRISNTASFGGLKLLNGAMDYTLSGVNATNVAKAQVYGASFIGSSKLQVDVHVLGSAQVGALYLRGDYGFAPAKNGTVLSTTTLRISGSRGVSELTITSGTSYTDLAKAVNSITQLTGISAKLINPSDMSSGIVFQSLDYGSKNFASVERLGGPADPTMSPWQLYSVANDAPPPTPGFDWNTLISSGTFTASSRDAGKDVTALINGTLATGDGLNVSINSQALSLKLILTSTTATTPSSAVTPFYITGGGALFQLGPSVTAQQQTNIGVQSVAASNLGGVLVNGSLQYLSSLKSGQVNSLAESFKRGDYSQASAILDQGTDEVSQIRGRLGAFEKNVLDTNVRSLQAAFENLTASESKIRDADFAEETSALTRAQILQSAGNTVLGLANQSSQQVLQLLQQG
jgi:flagellin